MPDLFIGFKSKMFGRIVTEVQTKISYLCGLILLCFGYFNSFFISELTVTFFQVSSLTGQLLVNKFLTICDYIFEIVKHMYLFFQILYEDSLIFLKDATEKFAFALSVLKGLYLFLEECLCHILKTVFLFVETMFQFFGIVHNAIGSVKQGLQVTGLTIWLTFTNIPQAVVSKIIGINEFLTNTFYEILKYIFKLEDKIIESVRNMYLFLFDVSLDSVYGLIIGAFFLTITCVMFKSVCYFISRTFLKLLHFAASLAMSLRSGSLTERNTRRFVDYSYEDDERLCIICQYQLKDVIIFPCKHLCLCQYCSTELSKNKPVCPICRSDIAGTLKVYV